MYSFRAWLFPLSPSRIVNPLRLLKNTFLSASRGIPLYEAFSRPQSAVPMRPARPEGPETETHRPQKITPQETLNNTKTPDLFQRFSRENV